MAYICPGFGRSCLATLLILGGCDGSPPHRSRSSRPKSSTASASKISRESLRGRAQPVQGHRGAPPGFVYAPRARFLIGETYFREGEFDKAVKEFEAFLAFYPQHQIADLVQYRLAGELL